MKSFLQVAAVLAVVGLLALVMFLRFPLNRRAEDVKAAIAASRQRRANLMVKATDPKQNGYLSQPYLLFWGTRSQARPNSPVGLAVETWRNFSTAGSESGQPVDHAALCRLDEYIEARAGFAQVWPGLHQALSKPVFSIAVERPTFDSEVVQIVALRQTAQALCGWAENALLENRPEVAAQAIGDVIELGSHITLDPSSTNALVGVSLQAIGFNALVHLLPPQTELTAEQWQDLAVRVRQSVPPQGQIATLLEEEITIAHNGFEDLYQGKASHPLTRLPWLVRREERIYYNVMTDLLAASRQDELVVMPTYLTNPGTTSYLTGKTSYVANLMVPDLSKASGQLLYNRYRVAAAALATEVIAYQAAHHSLPPRLQLDGLGISPSMVVYDPTNKLLKVNIPAAVRRVVGHPVVGAPYPPNAFFQAGPEGFEFRF
ncbi:MAG: hypothetical protein KC910_06795 [Candidatus Eremiobacteraeota bacterium]|nr:hypothetical protein [Candidatus Eremiobacteraeota bacterium]